MRPVRPVRPPVSAALAPAVPPREAKLGPNNRGEPATRRRARASVGEYMRVRSKPASELVSSDPAMPLIRSWLAGAKRPIEILACRPDHGAVALEALQVTTRSPLGSITYETGGVLVDDGWLRILGAGSPKLARTIAGWNGLPCDAGEAYLPGAMFVAHDAIGCKLAGDVGALGATRGYGCF